MDFERGDKVALHRLPLSCALASVLFIAGACGSSTGGRSGGSGGHDSSSGGSGSGGSSSGGSGSGGTTASGGTTGGTGGMHGTGGESTGGVTGSTGGIVGTGGTASGTGGTTSGGSGGVGSGGMTGTGGVSASGGAAGHAGVSGTGGATGAGGHATGCAGTSYKLCEDFESSASGSIPSGWTVLPGYGGGASQGVGASTVVAHSGVVALQSNSSMTGQARVQKSLTGLGATASKHWGRIFYKVQTPPVIPTSGVLHITLVALQGTTEDRVVDLVENSDGKHQWLFNVPDDSCCTSSTYDWSFDADWHCAEWYVDASTQTYRFFTDKTEVKSIGFMNNTGAKMSNWTAIGLGAIFYQSPPSPVTIWFDDLAIDDSQIGCD